MPVRLDAESGASPDGELTGSGTRSLIRVSRLLRKALGDTLGVVYGWFTQGGALAAQRSEAVASFAGRQAELALAARRLRSGASIGRQRDCRHQAAVSYAHTPSSTSPYRDGRTTENAMHNSPYASAQHIKLKSAPTASADRPEASLPRTRAYMLIAITILAAMAMMPTRITSGAGLLPGPTESVNAQRIENTRRSNHGACPVSGGSEIGRVADNTAPPGIVRP